jgi:dTDP-4-dehydrorhamnose reductase
MSKPDECELNQEAAYQTNVKGTEYLLEAAVLCKSYFLFVSTDFVFAGTSLHYKEDDSLDPVNYYGETKMLAEAAVEKYPFSWSIVRTILVYGKPMSGRQNILTNVAAALQRGEPLRIFSDQTRTPTYVEDLAKAMVVMLENRSRRHLSYFG